MLVSYLLTRFAVGARTFNQKFDFIHARALCASSKDWPSVFRQAFDALRPGGWFEINDITVYVGVQHFIASSGHASRQSFMSNISRQSLWRNLEGRIMQEVTT